MMWLFIIIAYALLAIITGPHRYSLAPNERHNEPGAWTIFSSPIWPLYYLYKGSEALLEWHANPEERRPSRKMRRANERAAASKAREEEIERQMASVKELRKMLRESQTDSHDNWSKQYQAMGGSLKEVESRAEEKRRHDREAEARRLEYERQRAADRYEVRYGRDYR